MEEETVTIVNNTMTPNFPTLPVDLATLYEQDYYLWIETTVKLLQQERLAEVDLANLIEEVADMGKATKNALKSNLKVVLMHLLKYKYQPEKRSKSWRSTLFEHRDRIQESLSTSPSLQPYLQEVFGDCYQTARKKAAIETGLDISTFPSKSPFSLEATLNPDYLPQ